MDTYQPNDFGLSPETSLDAGRVKKTYERSAPRFLQKLFFILETELHAENICWSSDGEAICIKDPDKFAAEVLPCYFKHNNFHSFVRQLNMYNFKKKKASYGYQAYSHEMFRKGKPDLLKKIHRNGLPSNLPSNLTSNLPQNIPVAKSDARNIETYAKELVQENLQYKRTQKELSMRLGMVDRTTLEVKIKAQSLCIESQKQDKNIRFLEQVIKQFGVLYGTESIAQAIELAVHSLEPRNVKVEAENGLQGGHQISLPFPFMDYRYPNKIENFEWSDVQDPLSAFQNHDLLSGRIDYSLELKKEHPEAHKLEFSSQNDYTDYKNIDLLTDFGLPNY